jgi:hypothetical protein
VVIEVGVDVRELVEGVSIGEVPVEGWKDKGGPFWGDKEGGGRSNLTSI